MIVEIDGSEGTRRLNSLRY